MSLPVWPDCCGGRVLTLAGNDLTIDTRALKTGRSMANAGYSVLCFGLASSANQARTFAMGQATGHRLDLESSPRITDSPIFSVSGLIDRLAYETELQRERLQMSRRNLLAQQGAGALASTLGRYRTVAKQRRYQVTRLLFQSAHKARRRLPGRFVRWRKALPETHRWEAAIGPLVDHLQPDLIHCHDVFHLGVAVRAKRRQAKLVTGHRMTVVYDAQEFIPGLPSDLWRRRAFSDLEREYIGDADAVITVSPSLADLLRDEYGVEASIVLNAPSRSEATTAVPGVRDQIGLAPDKRLLVYVGGLAPDRGADDLINSLQFLDDQTHLVFVTNAVSGYRTTLEARTVELGIGERVHFAPFVEPDAVTSYISSADVSVIPLSRDVVNYEVALPNKLFQTLHAGIPLVVSDNPEMKRFVEHHQVGAVFTGGDPRSLADAVEKVFADQSKISSALANEAFLDEMSWERQADVLTNIYSSLGVTP